MLNWVKANFEGMGQDLAQVDLRRLFDGKGTSGKWNDFKSLLTIVQDMHVPVRVKVRAGKRKEVWMREVGFGQE